MSAGLNFLFINKHGRSGQLTQSSGSEKTQIFRHAQQTSMRSNGDVFRDIKFSLDSESDTPAATVPSKSRALAGSKETRPQRKTAGKGQADERQRLAVSEPGRTLPMIEVPFESAHEVRLWQACEYCLQRTITPELDYLMSGTQTVLK